MKIEEMKAKAKMLADYWGDTDEDVMTGDEKAARYCAKALLKAIPVIEAAKALRAEVRREWPAPVDAEFVDAVGDALRDLEAADG